MRENMQKTQNPKSQRGKKVEQITQTQDSATNYAATANIVVIRIRGNVTLNREIERTLLMLGLYKRNFCTVIPKNPAFSGMLHKVKDHVTWGEIDDSMLKELQEKRGEKGKKFFRLNSPRGGLGRRGVKATFKKAGALGYRGSKVNDLIKKML